jgi:hypothetical protein
VLNARRSLSLNADAGRELPRVPGLKDLYRIGARPRHGEVIMVAGRSGSQKSGFALWWTAQMNLPTLYFSADMSGFQASSRLASMATGHTVERVSSGLAEAGVERDFYLNSVSDLNLNFSFGSPIRWQSIDEEIEAWVELNDGYPEVIVIDNLMDFDGAQSGYDTQMETMAGVGELSRATGATVIILHHASDKSWEAKTDPWAPPSRDQVKGGLSEKPELSLSVALEPGTNTFRVAVIKQRMGPSDPTAKRYVALRCEPEYTRFGPLVGRL